LNPQEIYCKERTSEEIISDNGKTFKAAAKAVRAVMDNEDVKHFLSGIGIE